MGSLEGGSLNVYQLAICDDSKPDADYVSLLAQQWARERGIALQISVYPSAEAFLFGYEEDKSFDILLLDIEMGEMDGITLAKGIRKENERLQIVFVTGFSDFMAEGYEVSALHYLMKPVAVDKLSLVLDRAIKNLQKAQKTVVIDAGGEKLRLPVDQIFYVEAFAHHTMFVLEDRQLQVNRAISEVEKILTRDMVRCHRSYLVGLRHIDRITKDCVILDNGTELPLSRGCYATVNQAFLNYYKEAAQK